jgi:hypothetical protein
VNDEAFVRVLVAALAHSDAPALRFRHRALWTQLTGVETLRRCSEVAHGLLAGGIVPGDAILIDVDTGPDWLFVDIGASLIGVASITAATVAPAPALAVVEDARRRGELGGVPAGSPITIVRAGDAGGESPLDLLAARGVAWAASNQTALDETLRVTGPQTLRSIDLDGSLRERDWAQRVAATPDAVASGRRVLIDTPLSDRSTRAVAYAALVRGAVVGFRPDALPLAAARPDVLVADGAAVGELATRIQDGLQHHGGLIRSARGRHGRLARIVRRRSVTAIIGDALRVVLATGVVEAPARDALSTVGVRVVAASTR